MGTANQELIEHIRGLDLGTEDGRESAYFKFKDFLGDYSDKVLVSNEDECNYLSARLGYISNDLNRSLTIAGPPSFAFMISALQNMTKVFAIEQRIRLIKDTDNTKDNIDFLNAVLGLGDNDTTKNADFIKDYGSPVLDFSDAGSRDLLVGAARSKLEEINSKAIEQSTTKLEEARVLLDANKTKLSSFNFKILQLQIDAIDAIRNIEKKLEEVEGEISKVNLEIPGCKDKDLLAAKKQSLATYQDQKEALNSALAKSTQVKERFDARLKYSQSVLTDSIDRYDGMIYDQYFFEDGELPHELEDRKFNTIYLKDDPDNHELYQYSVIDNTKEPYDKKNVITGTIEKSQFTGFIPGNLDVTLNTLRSNRAIVEQYKPYTLGNSQSGIAHDLKEIQQLSAEVEDIDADIDACTRNIAESKKVANNPTNSGVRYQPANALLKVTTQDYINKQKAKNEDYEVHEIVCSGKVKTDDGRTKHGIEGTVIVRGIKLAKNEVIRSSIYSPDGKRKLSVETSILRDSDSRRRDVGKVVIPSTKKLSPEDEVKQALLFADRLLELYKSGKSEKITISCSDPNKAEQIARIHAALLMKTTANKDNEGIYLDPSNIVIKVKGAIKPNRITFYRDSARADFIRTHLPNESIKPADHKENYKEQYQAVTKTIKDSKGKEERDVQFGQGDEYIPRLK
ncbi:MAG: hypothetical protein P1U74_03785 [Legionellaceae bacterium]|nr:hypothetical protein [Legionellaceae bacterium]